VRHPFNSSHLNYRTPRIHVRRLAGAASAPCCPHCTTWSCSSPLQLDGQSSSAVPCARNIGVLGGNAFGVLRTARERHGSIVVRFFTDRKLSHRRPPYHGFSCRRPRFATPYCPSHCVADPYFHRLDGGAVRRRPSVLALRRDQPVNFRLTPERGRVRSFIFSSE
jgi:hypothetical protein